MNKKLVDTTETFGRAELEITYSDLFKRFMRNKYSVKEIKDIDLPGFVKKYNLKGVVFGNYVTQEERYFMLFKVSKQIETLAKIRGNNNIGKGTLIISLGGHGIGGKAAAFYSPPALINIARGRKGDYTDFLKGENSFVHEYGHFLDFIQGRQKDKTLHHNFASENTDANWTNKETLIYSTPVTTVTEDESYMKGLEEFSNAKYLQSRIEVFARLFEASLTHYIHMNHKADIKFFDRLYREKIYYPKAKIIKNKFHLTMAKILQRS